MMTKELKVSEVFERYPETRAVFARFGFHALSSPLLRKTFGRFTSIERGCRLHGVSLEEFLTALNQVLQDPPEDSPPVHAQPANLPEELNGILNMNIASFLERHPACEAVFTKHFGGGCFCCPAFGTETVQFACLMHQTDPVSFAKECLEMIEKKA